MKPVIAQLTLKLIKFFLLLLFLLPSVGGTQSSSSYLEKLIALPQRGIQTPAGDQLDTLIASTPPQMAQGLSGIKESEFKRNQALFFNYKTSAPRRFWMPDTYFGLDLLFLSSTLKITHIVRKLKHHKGRQGKIPTTKAYPCRYVVELRSDGEIAKKLRVGDQLKWTPLASEGRESKTRSSK